jgi:uncharacterized protein (DUF1015 family)
MAKIFPFKGIHYKVNVVGDLTEIVTQPYDQIKEDLREIYYSRHGLNFVRVIQGRTEPDTDMENVYTRAADYMNEWLRDGILIRDDKRSLYVYHQEYEVDGEIRVRKGFIPLVELQEYGEGVKAHEKTLDAPKEDRLKLMKTTQGNTELIFMLYSEPERDINKALDRMIEGKQPELVAKDDFGCVHKVWAVSDEETIKFVQKKMEKLALFIADGHHRYETAINYMKYLVKNGAKWDDDVTENPQNCMMTLVNVDEPGLTVLPTHRVVHDVADDLIKTLTSRITEYFTIEHFPLAKNELEAIQKVLDAMKERQNREHLFCLYIKGDDELKLLSLKDESSMNSLVTGFSDDWKKLDIAILHTILLDKLLGIDAARLAAKTNVSYYRSPFETFEKTKSDPKYQCMFLVNPTGVEEVKKIASHGEKMPQKSTDFFPKLLSGLVMNKMILK